MAESYAGYYTRFCFPGVPVNGRILGRTHHGTGPRIYLARVFTS